MPAAVMGIWPGWDLVGDGVGRGLVLDVASSVTGKCKHSELVSSLGSWRPSFFGRVARLCSY